MRAESYLPPPRIAYVATLYWAVFAGFNLYWAAGGTMGLTTLGEGIESLADAREHWFVALVAITGLLKLVPAIVVLSLVHSWGDRFSMTGRVIAVGGLGALSVLYGGVSMVQKLLVLAGIISVENLDSAGFWGHLLIWDPLWILCGILLWLVAWQYYRDSHGGQTIQ